MAREELALLLSALEQANKAAIAVAFEYFDVNLQGHAAQLANEPSKEGSRTMAHVTGTL